jgi:prephenate dehydrogenase
MNAKPKFNTACIIGVGLIGGSLARVLKARGLAENVVGSGRSKVNIDSALELGIIDQALPPEEAVKRADIVFLCGPVRSIIPTLENIAPHLKEGALVSDVGSTKRTIVEEAEKISAEGRFTFIGAHPIAGTEKSGAEAAFETLFDGHKCIITPTGRTPNEELEKLKSIWKTAGTEVVIMTPDENDRVFGAVSHLPHIVVYSLVNAVCDMNEEDDLIQFAAGGFKDFTRIASSPPEMWADISIENFGILPEQIDIVIEQMKNIRSAISERDKEKLMGIFKKSNVFRNNLA